MSIVMTLVPAFAVAALVTAAQPAAAAADGQVAAQNVSYGLLGPVGIAAVVLGFGGLIVGLLRHRRRDAGAGVPVRPPVEPHAGERAA